MNEDTCLLAIVKKISRRCHRHCLSNSQYYRVAISDQSGNFVIGGVVPGDYVLFAWQDIERGQYLDADFIQYEDMGRPIHVEEGGRSLGVQLRLATQTRDSNR